MNILTFDLEDWFHILDHPETENPSQWSSFESRIERNVDRILNLLEEHKQRSTWFCLGWVAQKYPQLIRKISLHHEIACHSDMHQLVYKQTPSAFKDDTQNALKRLEDLTGKKITSYRASGFSITKKNAWAFEILSECGIQTDCSVFPAHRNHGGFADFPANQPCRIEVNGSVLKVFPINTYSLAGRKIIFSGGGYFRLLPYSMIRMMSRRSNYILTYFHPRDFDPAQPVLHSLSWKRKFMSYTGLKNTETKFLKWITEFPFTDLQTANDSIDWDKTRIIRF